MIADSVETEPTIVRSHELPRIDDRIVESVFYLYHSQDEAEDGVRDGGTGFLISVKSELHPFEFDVYAVTCSHVIEAGAVVVRMETLRGCINPTRIYPLAANQWNCSTTDDIAIAYLGRKNYEIFDHRCIPSFLLLTEEVVDIHDISLGDEVYMVGRFKFHDGKNQNRPSVRSGIISSMAAWDDPVTMEEDDSGNPTKTQEAFLIELRSISGWSGSPVVWQLPLVDIVWASKLGLEGGRQSKEGSDQLLVGPWLVGIEIATWADKGVSVVVPAWKIQEMLDTEERRAERAIEDDKSSRRIGH